jgi:hypothetical protein
VCRTPDGGAPQFRRTDAADQVARYVASFVFGDAPSSIREAVKTAFRASRPAFGVYVLRTSDGSVVYVGKGGTIGNGGEFKGQDIPGRLVNVRTNDMSAEQWFRNVVSVYGLLQIEYVILPKSRSPGFVEALLLQAYLNDHGKLPPLNKSL